jgi:hypothetical protein
MGLVFFISCSQKEEMPEGILKQDKMQAVLWDVMRAEAFTSGFIQRDTLKNSEDAYNQLQQQVFEIHQVTRHDFYKSYDYYKMHVPAFKIIVDSMISKASTVNSINTNNLQAE